MASTESPLPNMNTLTEITKADGGNIGISSKGKNTGREEGTVRPGEESSQQLHQKIASLERELDIERQLRMQAQDSLRRTRQQWKQMAQELTKHDTDAKPFHIVTDDYLKQLVEELRYDIRCFSEKYFEDLPPTPWPHFSRRNGSFPLPERYAQCPASPALAQSFIWRLLERRVFGRYQWPANERVSRGLYTVSKSLRPIRKLSEADDPSVHEALKKFHTWRAITANMIFLNEENPVEVQSSWKSFAEIFIGKYIDRVMLTFVPRSEHERYSALLWKIIEKTLILDREISRQASWVCWLFEGPENNSETVEAAVPISQECLRIITAPALIKRGKSSGEGYEEQIELLGGDTADVVNLLSLGDKTRDVGIPFTT
ncbi:hypothetical protein ANO14919_085750 [Xylariales sp. No.14919]|nr:hypothetical protein ANO14919_085750 [Xylariales sp. No.14919]